MALNSDFADDPTMTELLEAYVAGLSRDVQSLRRHVAASDAAAARRLLHQLKGSGASYGFPPLTRHAGAAEALLQAGHPLPEAQPHITALIAAIESIDGYRPG